MGDKEGITALAVTIRRDLDMQFRPGLILLCLLGCQGPRMPFENLAFPDATAAAVPATPPRVIRLADPAGPADSELDVIAKQLERGQNALAATGLRHYVDAHPRHILVRAQLGELLFRLRQYTEARQHFELFLALAGDDEEVALRYRIHSHSRLVELAEADEDAYAEHLHRGLGLYWLACRRAKEADPEEGTISATGLFHRGVAELILAQRARPTEARPPWYQYLIWHHLGQSGSAHRALVLADRLALKSDLTPVERRSLQQACLRHAVR